MSARAYTRRVSVAPDPLQLFEAHACFEGRVLLESAEPGGARSEKSLVVVDAALHVCCIGRDVIVRALSPRGRALLDRLAKKMSSLSTRRDADDRICVSFASPPSKSSEEQRMHAPSPTDVLRAVLSVVENPAIESQAKPMIVGTFAYDMMAIYETLPEPNPADAEAEWPDYEFWLVQSAYWIDHANHNTLVVTYSFSDDVAHQGDARTDLAALVDGLQQLGKAAPAAEHVAKQPNEASASVASVDLDDAAYRQLVETCQQHIVAGEVFQIVPSRTYQLPCTDPLAAYRRLRFVNPSPYMFYIVGSRGVLFGASPETAVSVHGTPRRVRIFPLAGTRPRARDASGTIDADRDGRLEADLRLDQKEVAEHMMLVDLARNDVARVSVTGSRRVDRLLDVVRYSHVMHLASQVSGELRAGLDALHAYVATLNMGTLVGAPKVKAAQLLRRYEATRRGAYGGAVGYLTSDGRMDTGIIIRAAVVRDGVAHVRAGAGVVYDSDPQQECDETRRKAQAVLNAIETGG